MTLTALAKYAIRAAATEWSVVQGFVSKADVALFHAFRRPPYGGGNQFMLAFAGQLKRTGLRVELNNIPRATRACICNSFNFEPQRLRRLQRNAKTILHRVDGPLQLYRGYDDGTDTRVVSFNQEFADVTVLQSRYSLKSYLNLGINFRCVEIIPNAADPTIFYPAADQLQRRSHKIHLISTAWSDNLNKGFDLYEWLDQNLDFSVFAYTFVGNSPRRFANINVTPPADSMTLANLLRQHDIYVTASRYDPASNSLTEALACGLPAVYLNCGGHAEIAQAGGEPFHSEDDVLLAIDKVVSSYRDYKTRIRVPELGEIVARYLAHAGVSTDAR